VGRNVEIKARVADLDSIRRTARSLSSAPSDILKQADTFFVVPRGRLKVREFADGSGELIRYDRPDQSGPKESRYTRIPCPDARSLSDIVSQTLPVRGTVVKRREVFRIGATRLHLDQVEGLGDFLELEVVLTEGQTVAQGQQVADQLIRALQIPETAFVAAAYIDLLEQRPTT
jgi:adenylate cyclase class IV